MRQCNFFAVILCVLIFTAAIGTGGCGGSSNSFDSPHTPTPAPSGYTVIFDSLGGSYIEAQVVEPMGKAAIPNDPVKNDSSFMGWYPSEGFAFRFDFSTAISRDIILYAKWWDHNDTTDTDGDGLIDSLELMYGTDLNNVDTDGDGLSDYEELNWLEYNPLVRDTDGNGVEDGNEDADSDGLTNIEEASSYGTDMIIADTDRDGLYDYAEVVTYGTNPLNPDTDGDGVNDAVEVAIGSDPLVPERTFATVLSSDRTAENPDAIDIAVTMTSSADAAGTLQVRPADYSDNPLITSGIPGYLAAYNISADGKFDSAEITFTLGSGIWVDSEDFQPRIYFLNEKTGILEEVPNQRAENGKITASVSHFSIYVLINKVRFNGVWSTEIRLPKASGDAALNFVFVIDCSGSMQDNDSQRLAISLSQNFIDELSADRDKAAAVKFDSRAHLVHSLTDDKEALKDAIDTISYYGGTNGSAGLKMALDILDSSSAAYKYIMFLTDGDDTSRSYSYDDLIERAKGSGVTVYTIGMGSAVENTLRRIASGTGGAYYKATTGTALADMVSLDVVFDEIQREVIDMRSDSNGDGISDYFTKLLNDGKLVLSNGSAILVGVTDHYGTSTDDWDGDGLTNGEEITIVSADYGDRIIVTAYMNTNPIYWDTDFDGYSDGQEVNVMHTSPLKYTIAQEDISRLISDTYFPQEYINASMPDDSIFDTVSMYVYAGDVKKKAIKALVEYFQKYPTSKDVLAKDALAARRLQQCRDLHDGIALISDLLTAAKSFVAIADDIGAENYNTDEKAKKVFQDTGKRLVEMIGAKFADVDTINKAAKLALQEAQQEQLKELLTTRRSSSKDFLSDLNDFSSDIDSLISSNDLIKVLDIGAKFFNSGLQLTKVIMDVGNKFNKINLPCKWEWMDKLSSLNSSVEKATHGLIDDAVGTSIQLVVNALELQENYYEIAATYGQIAANYYEYQKYIAILRRIANDKRFSSYVQAAAAEVAGMFDASNEPNWGVFQNKLKAAQKKSATLTVLKDIVDFGTDKIEEACPVLLIADIVYKLFMSWSGANDGYDTIAEAQIYYAITDASRNIFAGTVDLVNGYLESKIEGDIANKYAVQLAQSRIIGVDLVKEYLLNGKLASWIIGLIVNKSQDYIRQEYEEAISNVYDIARKNILELSDKLPNYPEN